MFPFIYSSDNGQQPTTKTKLSRKPRVCPHRVIRLVKRYHAPFNVESVSFYKVWKRVPHIEHERVSRDGCRRVRQDVTNSSRVDVGCKQR